MRLATLLARRNDLFLQFVRTRALFYRGDYGMPPLTYEQALCIDEVQRIVCSMMSLWDLEWQKFPIPKYADVPIELPELNTQLILEREHTEEWPPEYMI